MGEHIDVSVIVAVRDRAATVAECLDSVLSQEGCRTELIVVDGDSTDGTREIVARYRDHIVLIEGVVGGVTPAWNRALMVANGRWCAFLGADDALEEPRALMSLLACARDHEAHAGEAPVLVAGVVRMIGAGPDKLLSPASRDPAKRLRSGRMLPHVAALHDTASLRDEGGFDESFRVAADLEMAIRLSDRGPVAPCGSVVATMRAGGLSTSPITQALLDRERLRILRRQHGAIGAGPRLAFLAARDRAERMALRFFPRVIGHAATDRIVLFGRGVGAKLRARR